MRVGDVVWRGIGPRLGEAIARAMDVRLELVELTWGNAVAALQANQIDTMFILDPTPERALAVDFVQSPGLFLQKGLGDIAEQGVIAAADFQC